MFDVGNRVWVDYENSFGTIESIDLLGNYYVKMESDGVIVIAASGQLRQEAPPTNEWKTF